MDINSFTEHQHPRGGPGHRQQRGPRPGHRNVRTSPSPAAGVTAASGVNHSPRPLLSRPHPFPRAANWKRAGLLRPRPATRAPGEKPRDSALWRRPLNFLVDHGEAPICFDSSVETEKWVVGRENGDTGGECGHCWPGWVSGKAWVSGGGRLCPEQRWTLTASSRGVRLLRPPGRCLWPRDPSVPARAALLVVNLGEEMASERAWVTQLGCG